METLKDQRANKAEKNPCTSMREGRKPSEGYKQRKMEKLSYGSRKDRAVGSGRKVKELMGGQSLIQG